MQRDRNHQTDTDPHRPELDLRPCAPILALPNELICEIFGYVDGPAVLAEVCRHWRRIALSRPTFWSRLVLRLNDSTLEKTWVAARLSLLRSGSTPFSLSLRYGPNFVRWCGLGSLFTDFLGDIVNHLSRLERLDIRVILHGDTAQFLRLPMPQLTHLSISVRCLNSSVTMVESSVPELRSIDFYRFTPLGGFECPWRQLTSLSFDHIDFDDLHGVLLTTPALVHCAVSRMRRSFTHAITQAPKPKIVLEHLQSLRFSLYELHENPVHGVYPLSFFGLKKLRSLRLLQIPETYLHYPAYTDVLELVQESGCRLEELRVIDVTFTSEQTWIDTFPSVSVSFLRQLPDSAITV